MKAGRCTRATICALMLSVCATPAASTRPNVVLIMADDMGFSDLGCYGGEIETPNIDQLAASGVRFTGFRNTSRCCPSRASLMTGRYAHSVDMGWMTAVDEHRPGYRGQLAKHQPTLAEILSNAGYSTFMAGKWHLTVNGNYAARETTPNGSWPTQRGFDQFYGGLSGGGSYWKPNSLARNLTRITPESLPSGYYYTDAITDAATDFLKTRPKDKPLFLYVAHYAPHRPMQAPEARIQQCMDRYKAGYDVLRRERFERQVAMGIVPAHAKPGKIPSWTSLNPEARSQWIREMSTYAAMIEIMDDGVGELIQTLEEQGELENTLVIFLSDNGATREGGLVSQRCADLSNTPYRQYKRWTYQGGTASPLIMHWPAGITARDAIRHGYCHIIDILPSLLEAADATVPTEFRGHKTSAPDGISLMAGVRGAELPERDLFWEHETSRAVVHAGWKLVAANANSAWELYNLETDPCEQRDLAATEQGQVNALDALWTEWAEANNVLPLETRGWTERINYYKKRFPNQNGEEGVVHTTTNAIHTGRKQ